MSWDVGRDGSRQRMLAVALFAATSLVFGAAEVAKAQSATPAEPPSSLAVAPPAAPDQASAPVGPPLQLNFTDARPAKERKTRPYFTLWRLSCEFGVQDLGDELADRVGQLRHDIVQAYGSRMVGKTIVVDHYHLYLNERSMEAQNSTATAVFGVFALGAGAKAKTTHPACTKDKMSEGWFDPSELTTPWSPFIVEMEVHLDGQGHLVHSVYSPPKNMPAPGVLTDYDVKAEAEAVHAAVDKANAAMVAELGGQLGSAVATDGH